MKKNFFIEHLEPFNYKTDNSIQNNEPWQFQDLFNPKTIQETEKSFKFLEKYPSCSTVCLALFITALGLPMLLNGATNAFISILIIGIIICSLNYFFTKTFLSFFILHIHYVRNIRDNIDFIADTIENPSQSSKNNDIQIKTEQ